MVFFIQFFYGLCSLFYWRLFVFGTSSKSLCLLFANFSTDVRKINQAGNALLDDMEMPVYNYYVLKILIYFGYLLLQFKDIKGFQVLPLTSNSSGVERLFIGFLSSETVIFQFESITTQLYGQQAEDKSTSFPNINSVKSEFGYISCK